uniref:Uncharacterized protein n=1 Tax=Opuntia streptacantha TaxID=393608 RepID=A0A7C9CXK7_OPUST
MLTKDRQSKQDSNCTNDYYVTTPPKKKEKGRNPNKRKETLGESKESSHAISNILNATIINIKIFCLRVKHKKSTKFIENCHHFNYTNTKFPNFLKRTLPIV